jgi:transcriptional pleiotropic regulator of transition state genes
MKPVNVVRNVDQLGRVVLPKRLRKQFDMNEGDPVEIFVQGDMIFMEKYRPKCVFCGSGENVAEYKAKNLCMTCMSDLALQKDKGAVSV